MTTCCSNRILFITAVLFITGLAVCSDAGMIESGLIAYYPFNGNAEDATGNGHNGTVVGAQLTTDRFGNADAAYQFDGSSLIEAADHVNLRLASTDFTLSTWSKSLAAGELHSALLVKRHTGYNDGWFLSLKTLDSESPTPYYRPGGGNYGPVAIADENVQLGTWVHTVVTYKLATQTIRFYIDGEFVSSQTGMTPPNPTCNSRMTIGQSSNDGLYGFKGSIDDVRIYGRALSGEEVAELYAIPEPTSAGLIAVLTGTFIFIRRWFCAT